MTWDEQSIEIMRVMLNDLSDTETFSDETLLRVLLVAGFQVNLELDFDNDYVVDFDNQTITPDPVASLDNDFVNLMCLKGACIVDKGAARLAATQSIAVKDGSSAIDLRGVSAARQKLLEKGGWCPAYTEAKAEFEIGEYGVTAGAAVMTPFRLYAQASYPRLSGFNPDRSRDWQWQ